MGSGSGPAAAGRPLQTLHSLHACMHVSCCWMDAALDVYACCLQLQLRQQWLMVPMTMIATAMEDPHFVLTAALHAAVPGPTACMRAGACMAWHACAGLPAAAHLLQLLRVYTIELHAAQRLVAVELCVAATPPVAQHKRAADDHFRSSHLCAISRAEAPVRRAADPSHGRSHQRRPQVQRTNAQGRGGNRLSPNRGSG